MARYISSAQRPAKPERVTHGAACAAPHSAGEPCQRCPQHAPRGESPSASHPRSTLTHPPTERNAAGPSASPPSRSAEERGSLGPPAPQETAGTGRPPAGGEGERRAGGCTHLASSSSGVAGHFAARRAVTGCEEEAGAVPQGHGRALSRESSSAGGSSGAQPAMRSTGARGRPAPHGPRRCGVCPAHTAMPLSYWLHRGPGVALLVSSKANQRQMAHK